MDQDVSDSLFPVATVSLAKSFIWDAASTPSEWAKLPTGSAESESVHSLNHASLLKRISGFSLPNMSWLARECKSMDFVGLPPRDSSNSVSCRCRFATFVRFLTVLDEWIRSRYGSNPPKYCEHGFRQWCRTRYISSLHSARIRTMCVCPLRCPLFFSIGVILNKILPPSDSNSVSSSSFSTSSLLISSSNANSVRTRVCVEAILRDSLFARFANEMEVGPWSRSVAIALRFSPNAIAAEVRFVEPVVFDTLLSKITDSMRSGIVCCVGRCNASFSTTNNSVLVDRYSNAHRSTSIPVLKSLPQLYQSTAIIDPIDSSAYWQVNSRRSPNDDW